MIVPARWLNHGPITEPKAVTPISTTTAMEGSSLMPCERRYAMARGVYADAHVSSRAPDGLIRRGAQARLIRSQEPVWEGTVATLRRVKDDVREVAAGLECGIVLEGHNDVQARNPLPYDGLPDRDCADRRSRVLIAEDIIPDARIAHIDDGVSR